MTHVAEICLYGSSSAANGLPGFAFIVATPKSPMVSRGRNADDSIDGRYTTRTEAMWAAAEVVYHDLGIKKGIVRVYDIGGTSYAEFDVRKACPTAGDAKWIRVRVAA